MEGKLYDNKGKKWKKGLATLLAVSIMLAGSGCNSGVSQEEYDAVVSENEELQSKIEELESTIQEYEDEDFLEEYFSYEDFLNELGGDDSSWDTPLEDSFDEQDAISKLKVTEYEWKVLDYSYIGLLVENGSEYDLYLSCNMLFYDADKNPIGSQDLDESAVPPGGKIILTYSNEEPYDSYAYEFNLSDSYYTCVSQDLDVKVNTTSDKALVTVTNNGTLAAEFCKCTVLFLSGGKVVYTDYTYCVDDDSELKPGKSKTVELQSYEAFDDVIVCVTGRN